MLIQMTQDLYADFNDNKESDTEDVYGFGMYFPASTAFRSALDISFVCTDSSGALYVNLDKFKLGTILRKLNVFIWSDKGVICLWDDETVDYGMKSISAKSGTEMFQTGHVLFTFDRLSQALDGAHKDSSDYGILPYPKYGMTQKKYGTGVVGFYPVTMVPNSAKYMADEGGAVMEYLACYSYHCVLPVLADEALPESARNDPEATGVPGEIFGNIRIAPGCVFGIGTDTMMMHILIRNTAPVDASYRNNPEG